MLGKILEAIIMAQGKKGQHDHRAQAKSTKKITQ
jgi:hypothetical protein